jgi:hypothetical protein
MLLRCHAPKKIVAWGHHTHTHRSTCQQTICGMLMEKERRRRSAHKSHTTALSVGCCECLCVQAPADWLMSQSVMSYSVYYLSMMMMKMTWLTTHDQPQQLARAADEMLHAIKVRAARESNWWIACRGAAMAQFRYHWTWNHAAIWNEAPDNNWETANLVLKRQLLSTPENPLRSILFGAAIA